METRALRGITGRSWGVALLLALAVMAAAAPASQAASSVTLGGITITLESCQYFKSGNYTRFVYHVTGRWGDAAPYWVLGSCSVVRDAIWWSSPGFEWTTTPLVGLKFSAAGWNQKVYLYLTGPWSATSTPVGVSVGDAGSPTFLTGWVDGPVCGVSSLSIAVTAGQTVTFPPITGPGLFPALNGTSLAVESSAPGWALSVSEAFALPEGGSEAVVARALELAWGLHGSGAGTTSISVDYALRIAEADFASLPQGTYRITITYTVTMN